MSACEEFKIVASSCSGKAARRLAVAKWDRSEYGMLREAIRATLQSVAPDPELKAYFYETLNKIQPN